MSGKSEILDALAAALQGGTVTKSDVESVLNNSLRPGKSPKSSRLSAIDIMFYIVGIVLFAGISVLIGQSWDSGPIVRTILSTGVGTAFWTYVYLELAGKPGDIRRGLAGALLLCGSLLLVTGSFIITGEIINFVTYHFFAVAAVLLFIGGVHMYFGFMIKQKLIITIGILLAAASFPALAFGVLRGSGQPLHVYALFVSITGFLIPYAARVTARMSTFYHGMARSLDTIGSVIALLSLYAASFAGDAIGLFWLVAMIIGVIGLFYISITTRDRLMLGSGSFFLVLAIITASFRYSSGYGTAASLFISAAGLLATALIASTINRRYIKEV